MSHTGAPVSGTQAPSPTKFKATWLWLGLALALFLAQIIPSLSYRWVTDESWYAGPAVTLLHGDTTRDPGMGPNEQENQFDGRPAGNFVVMAAIFKVFGVSTVTARLYSVFAGIGIVTMTFLLARRYLGDLAAILAAFLIATDNIVVLVSGACRPEAMVTMFIVAATLAMLRYSRTGALRWAVASGLLIATGTMFHVTLLGAIVSLGLLAIIIDYRRGTLPIKGAAAYSAAYFAGLLPFIVWIASSPLRILGFREEFIGKATGTSFATKVAHEVGRYYDILGFKTLHGHGLDAIPLRAPIPLFFFICTFLLWKYRRQWFLTEMLFLIPTMLWLIYSVNKSSRYLALLTPLIVLVMAGAVSATQARRTLHRILVAVVVLIIFAQLGANMVLLRAARKANFNLLAQRLRSVVPPDQTAYGTITFWLAFKDQRYIASERTDPDMAAEKYGARYFILGDRMTVQGSEWEPEYYRKLNADLAALAARSKMVGEFPDPYYGDIRVYHLLDAMQPQEATR